MQVDRNKKTAILFVIVATAAILLTMEVILESSLLYYRTVSSLFALPMGTTYEEAVILLLDCRTHDALPFSAARKLNLSCGHAKL